MIERIIIYLSVVFLFALLQLFRYITGRTEPAYRAPQQLLTDLPDTIWHGGHSFIPGCVIPDHV
jgi:hypothetical protein